MSAGASAADKQARLAKLYDEEIAPAYATRFANLLLRRVRPTSGARVIEVGCATGLLTRELARRFDENSRITAFEEGDAFVAEARAKIRGAGPLRAPIALRVNPDVDPHTHQYISTGSKLNKFGIALNQVEAVYERAARMNNVEIVGVQMHIGSQITAANPFASAIEKVGPLVRALKSKFDIQFVSIGGGMGIIYRRALASGSGKWWRDHASEPSAFSVRDYADAVVPPLRELGIRILVEPGRFLVGNAGVLVTRVRYIKQTTNKTFAIVDAGMNDLIRPALYQSYHEIVPVIGQKTLTPTLSPGERGPESTPLPRGEGGRGAAG